jgi:hypothetical protein
MATKDVKDTVRKTAFNILGEKVHIKALSIANRERLLQEGLTDRVGGSFFRMCASQMVIQLVGVNSIVVSLLLLYYRIYICIHMCTNLHEIHKFHPKI